ncbi:MAG: 3-isopropylmalate dehydratase small subunit [Alphaproteobacteria bacterium]|nr:3-isopropylmalate dehydratase small subunit [Alphaproteobacteria bacterium]
MRAFTQLTGSVAPLDRANVDTDQIIPKQFLKSIHRTGFGDNLFDAWRFLDEGAIGVTPNERQINHEFVLNQPAYQGASVLLARRNFGCGSSREHAVWALLEYGFRCVIAPSFADIFLSNCFKNGLLAIVLEEQIVEQLFEDVARQGSLELVVDLPAQTVSLPGGEQLAFEIDENRKRALVEGLDDIGMTLGHAQAIRDFERAHARRMPWLFPELN